MKRLDDRTCVVTGAARGIGRAIAHRFHDEGGIVVLTDRDAGAGAAAAGVEPLDVREEADWQRLAERVPVADVLVNNAGVTGFEEGAAAHDPEHASLEDWRAVHRVNLDGTFLGCRYAIGAMKVRGTGSIVNISSRSGLVGIPMAAAYASSKAAIRNHTKTVALYCAGQGWRIRCNSVHPAAILTPMWEPMLGTGPDRAARMRAFVMDTPLPSPCWHRTRPATSPAPSSPSMAACWRDRLRRPVSRGAAPRRGRRSRCSVHRCRAGCRGCRHCRRRRCRRRSWCRGWRGWPPTVRGRCGSRRGGREPDSRAPADHRYPFIDAVVGCGPLKVGPHRGGVGVGRGRMRARVRPRQQQETMQPDEAGPAPRHHRSVMVAVLPNGHQPRPHRRPPRIVRGMLWRQGTPSSQPRGAVQEEPCMVGGRLASRPAVWSISMPKPVCTAMLPTKRRRAGSGSPPSRAGAKR